MFANLKKDEKRENQMKMREKTKKDRLRRQQRNE